jgi:predicted nucleotide-binding protein
MSVRPICPKWRELLTTKLPAATDEINSNNQLRIELRLAKDVIAAIQATGYIQQNVRSGRIAAQEATI